MHKSFLIEYQSENVLNTMISDLMIMTGALKKVVKPATNIQPKIQKSKFKEKEIVRMSLNKLRKTRTDSLLRKRVLVKNILRGIEDSSPETFDMRDDKDKTIDNLYLEKLLEDLDSKKCAEKNTVAVLEREVPKITIDQNFESEIRILEDFHNNESIEPSKVCIEDDFNIFIEKFISNFERSM